MKYVEQCYNYKPLSVQNIKQKLRKKVFPVNKFTRILALVLAVVMSLSLAACGGNSAADKSGDVAMQYMKPEEAKEKLNDSDYVFFDLRKTADSSANSIPGAQAWDMDAAKEGDAEAGKTTMTKATEGLDKKIILVCYSGKRYAQATTNALSAIGYDMSKVYTLEGGFKAWSEKYPELTTNGDVAEAPAVAVKDTFTYAVNDDMGNVLNYLTADDRVLLTLSSIINDGLFALLPDGSIDYCIAQSFTPSADGLTYTMVLKDGLKWSDGQDLTLEDVIFTFETYMAQNPNALAVNGIPVVLNKVDDKTLDFVLPSALASFPEDVANVPMLAKHIFDGAANLDMDLTKADGVVGCGPYKFVEYASGQYYKVVRNENYYGEPAKIENLVLQIITNDETAKAALMTGTVDAWIGTAANMDGLDDFAVNAYSEGRVAYVRINRVSPNMQDKDVRKAIFYAINRNDMLVAAYSSLDYATPSVSFLPKTNGYYTEDLEQYTQDTAKAQELLAGKAVPTLKLCYIGNDVAQTAQATVIQAQLKAVGVNVELCGIEKAAYMVTAYDNNDTTYDMYLGGYIMTIDPAGFDGMFASGNMINYASAEIDRLFDEGKATTDPAERKVIYTKLQQVVADEALFYPFGTNLRLLVTNPALKGLDDAILVPITTLNNYGKLYYAG